MTSSIHQPKKLNIKVDQKTTSPAQNDQIKCSI